MSSPRRTARLNHLELARQVVAVAVEQGLKAGDHLAEQRMAQACGVSRTPIREAFIILKQHGILSWRAEEGYFLSLGVTDGLAGAQARIEGEEQSLPQRILEDRTARRIPDVQSVSALARRYAVSRAVVLNTLQILSRDGLVLQLPGRAWQFQPMLDTPASISESFAFRLHLEPQAILAPGFALDSMRAGALRMQMRGFLDRGEARAAAADFHRTDFEFHSLIAECSGSRFFRGALMAHHRLRKLAQRGMAIPAFRLLQATSEHLDILDSLERKQPELAADQMALHLRRSSIQRPEAATRGVPPLFRGDRR